MPLPVSGQIALSDFNRELSKPVGSQIALNDADVRAMIGKTAGEEAAFSDYYGASAGGFVDLPTINDSDITVFPAEARAAFTFFRNGALGTANSGSFGWWSDEPETGIGDDYEVFVSVATGDTPTQGTMDTWLGITTGRTWAVATTDGILQCTLDITIRDAATQTTQDTAVFSLLANSSR